MGAMFSPLPLACRDGLERRYDGPIPPADPAAPPLPATQRARLFQRLAGEARQQMARRRAILAATLAPRDPRLLRLGRDLGLYRDQGVAWRGVAPPNKKGANRSAPLLP